MLLMIKKGALFGALFLCLPLVVNAEGRFAAPNVNSPADSFAGKFSNAGSDLNSSFLVARFNAKSKKALREGIETSDNISQITKSATDGVANILQSVVVLPGVNVDEIVIINQNQGDGIIVNQ